MAAEDAEGGPGGDGEGDHQGEEHGGGGADGDGAHVGPHQAADEGHGEDGSDDSPGGEDGGVAHFIDGVEGDLGEGLVSGTGHAEVAHDISTTTIASSTRMPIEKISAKRVIRLRV